MHEGHDNLCRGEIKTGRRGLDLYERARVCVCVWVSFNFSGVTGCSDFSGRGGRSLLTFRVAVSTNLSWKINSETH